MSFEKDLLSTRNKRADGRKFDERRSLEFVMREPGVVLASLGNSTKVLVTVSCLLTKPNPDRPFEGIVNFSLGFLDGVNSKESVVSSFLEKVWRETKPIDTESLCMIAGRQVWTIRVDIRVLQDDGNLIECLSAGILGAILSFRRPDVKVVGDEVIIFDVREKAPVPLGMRHNPVGVEIGVLSGVEEGFLIDPTASEESICDALVIFAVNSQKEICFASRVGSAILTVEKVAFLNQMAVVKGLDYIELIKKKLVC